MTQAKILIIIVMSVLFLASCKPQEKQIDECGKTIHKGERCFMLLPMDEIRRELTKNNITFEFVVAYNSTDNSSICYYTTPQQMGIFMPIIYYNATTNNSDALTNLSIKLNKN